jgi:hypothetical protein
MKKKRQLDRALQICVICGHFRQHNRIHNLKHVSKCAVLEEAYRIDRSIKGWRSCPECEEGAAKVGYSKPDVVVKSVRSLKTCKKFGQLKHCRELIQTVSLFGITCTYLPASRQLPTTTKIEEPASRKRPLSSDDSKQSVLCAGCGRSGHESLTCHFKNSKYFNGGSGPYIDSKAYALLKRDKPAYTESFLPRDFTKPSVL